MQTVSFLVRMPPELRQCLTEKAQKDERSVNWLIVSTLKRAMVAQKENAPAAVTAEAPI